MSLSSEVCIFVCCLNIIKENKLNDEEEKGDDNVEEEADNNEEEKGENAEEKADNNEDNNNQDNNNQDKGNNNVEEFDKKNIPKLNDIDTPVEDKYKDAFNDTAKSNTSRSSLSSTRNKKSTYSPNFYKLPRPVFFMKKKGQSTEKLEEKDNQWKNQEVDVSIYTSEEVYKTNFCLIFV
jgi:hypothetical protein